MSRLSIITRQELLRAKRVRSTISGTPERPRLSVFISNRHVIGQIIDDTTSQTLVYVSTVGNKDSKLSMIEKAKIVGADIAKQALKKKITKVVFDRGSKNYHGRIKALADSARENGLEF